MGYIVVLIRVVPLLLGMAYLYPCYCRKIDLPYWAGDSIYKQMLQQNETSRYGDESGSSGGDAAKTQCHDGSAPASLGRDGYISSHPPVRSAGGTPGKSGEAVKVMGDNLLTCQDWGSCVVILVMTAFCLY